jgi:hypothetical protein
MNELTRRITVIGLAVAVLGAVYGCGGPETTDVKSEADKIDKGLENSPPVPEDVAGASLGGTAEGAPPSKGRGGGP